MKITCVGGGPGGLWFAIAAMVQDPNHEITVLERRPPSTTYGWGIVYWDDLLDGVRRIDPPTAEAIRNGSMEWAGQHVSVQDHRPVHLGGTGYGMGRQRLIDVLLQRARALGVRVEFEQEVEDLAAAAEAADLVVLADGANSRLRRSRAEVFGTTAQPGGDKHIWLGSRTPFPDFTFAFEPTAEGWIWFHAYSFSGASTVIVECSEKTWRGLGFDTMDDAACLAELSKVFARHLGGHSLENRQDAAGRAEWATFVTVRNARWHDGNVVLLGDCAHSAHFSIGSGTRMALQDAATLATAVAACRPAALPAALQRYQDARQAAVLALQQDAERSALWFENVERHIRLDPVDFGYALRMRRDPGIEDGVQRSSLRYRLHRVTQWRLGRDARRMIANGRRAARQRRADRAPTHVPG